jgi:hypothetical protein
MSEDEAAQSSVLHNETEREMWGKSIQKWASPWEAVLVKVF